MDLDDRFKKLKESVNNQEISKLNNNIYNLNFKDGYLESLSQEKLIYIHVKLHNALSFKKPFAPIEKIKRVHNVISKLLKNHCKIDELDE